jgi:hypothetical protein
MIRVDAYRLAAIIEAYAACANSLHCRLMLDPQASDRQRSMQLKLVEAIPRLRDVRRARETWEARADLRLQDTGDRARDQRRRESAALDPAADAYICSVLNQTADIAAALQYPLTGQPWEPDR